MPTGKEFAYIPGDPWGDCDRCGFKYRQSQLRKEWTGLRVCATCFEPKHPQLNLRVYPERISVKNARPSQDGTPILLGNVVFTSLSSDASHGDNSIEVDSISGIADGYKLFVQTDSDGFWTTVNGTPSGSTVGLSNRLPGKASSGNLVQSSDGTNANQVTI